jgi:hypothetical protein
MSDEKVLSGADDLQFDRITSAPPDGAGGVTCAACQSVVASEYYDVNGSSVCPSCRVQIEAAAQVPRGLGPLLKAGLFGLGAGIVGAGIYYAVIALTNLEIGIVAILIGYMVGWAVRKGAGGRGARRFQVMALLLTYLAVGLAYMPIAIKGAMEAERQAPDAARADASRPVSGTQPSRPAGTVPADDAPSAGLVVALLFIAALTVAMPVLVVFGSLPSGLISALIIFVGMRQAWVMTAAGVLSVSGPYRVGAAPPAVGA